MIQYKIEDLPYVITFELDGKRYRDYELTVRTFNIDGKMPYLVYRYESPTDPEGYIFYSKSIEELVEYLKDFNLIEVIPEESEIDYIQLFHCDKNIEDMHEKLNAVITVVNKLLKELQNEK